MKTTKLLLAIATIAIILSSCKKKDAELTNAIPANAAYVMSVDVKSLIKKSEYDIFQNVTVERGINMGKAMLSKPEAVKMLDDLTKDVNSLGIDIKGDCYVYSDYKYFGFLIGVNNAEKVKNTFTNLSLAKDEAEITKEGDMYSVSLSPNVVICWDKSKLLVLGTVGNYFYQRGAKSDDVDLTLMAKKQMKQDAKESINSKLNFDKFLSSKKDVSVFQSISSVEAFEKLSASKMPKEVADEVKALSGITLASHLSFETGELKVVNEIYYETPEVEKKYKELTATLSGEMKGDQYKFIPENPIFLASTSLKGEGTLKYLERLKILDDYKKNLSEVEIEQLTSIFNGIDGDITFSLSNIKKTTKSYESYNGDMREYESTSPQISFFADSKNGEEVLSIITGKMKEEKADKLTKLDEKTYFIKEDGESIYFGLKENMLYITNDADAYKLIQSADSKNDYKDLVKGNVFFVTGNLDKVSELAQGNIYDKMTREFVDEGLNSLGSYEYVMSKDLSGSGKWELKDKSKNSLAVICQYVDKILNRMNESMPF